MQVDTEEMIRTDSNFHRLIEKAGGKINQRSFKVAQLDLVCPTPGYVFNATTNKCSKFIILIKQSEELGIRDHFQIVKHLVENLLEEKKITWRLA